MTDIFQLYDSLGPTKIIHIYEPGLNLKGILVIDNTAAGPAIGGLRMAADVSLSECARLARAMTLKNAAAGLPHGGGKSILFGDPKMPAAEKEQLIRAFARSLRDNQDYIFGPDMGTNEVCMAWVRDETGRAVGLPREIGGIPLDEIGATGWGVYQSTLVAAKHCRIKLEGARLAVQGFGAVGIHSANFLKREGVVLVAASDSEGSICNPQGLDIDALISHKNAGKILRSFPGGQAAERDAILDVECEIWIPAARPDVINESNAHRLKAQLIVQGANIPCTLPAEQQLHEQGIMNIPDFIANAGGVICAAMEYRGNTQQAAFDAITEKIRLNTEQMLALAQKEQLLPRQAATQLAEKRLKNAMQYRRFSSFSNAPNHL